MKIRKIIRTSTIPTSLNTFCIGILTELKAEGYEVVAVSSPGDAMHEIEEREGVRTIAVPMERRMSPIKDLMSLWRLIRVFRREKPDMVHSMTPKAGLLCMIAAWICRVPVRVHTFTGLVFPTATGLTRKILMLTDRITCACATHVVPEGEGVKNDLLNHHITRKPMRVLGHGNVRGIDIKRFDPAFFPAKRPGHSFTFVFVGRLVKDKGINELVEAFKRIKGARLVLVGSQEPDLDPLEPETINEITSNPAIEAVGEQLDVRPWYARADAFVFPSYREGFPNVVIEAGAMGLPSIVTDINGSREIVIDGKNGVIIPPRSVGALCVAMQSFIDNPGKVRSMGAAARPMVISRYEQGYVRRCLLDFYKEIME